MYLQVRNYRWDRHTGVGHFQLGLKTPGIMFQQYMTLKQEARPSVLVQNYVWLVHSLDLGTHEDMCTGNLHGDNRNCVIEMVK